MGIYIRSLLNRERYCERYKSRALLRIAAATDSHPPTRPSFFFTARPWLVPNCMSTAAMCLAVGFSRIWQSQKAKQMTGPSRAALHRGQKAVNHRRRKPRNSPKCKQSRNLTRGWARDTARREHKGRFSCGQSSVVGL